VNFEPVSVNPTECVTDYINKGKLLFFVSILTTFETSRIFGGTLGSIENWLEPKTEPSLVN